MKVFWIVFLLVFGSFSTASAVDGWHFTSFWGGSESFNSNLKVHLNGDEDYDFNADWEGKSLTDSWYYSLRFEKWVGNRARGFEYLHHKIYLKNRPEGIKHFSISDGFNMAFYNWARRRDNGWITRFGIGPVLAHMDVQIEGRDRFYMDGGIGGSYLAGFGMQFSGEKWIYETEKFLVSLEGKFTASYVRAPVSEDAAEVAEVPNYAVHFLIGFGAKPQGKRLKDNKHYIFPVLHHLLVYPLDGQEGVVGLD